MTSEPFWGPDVDADKLKGWAKERDERIVLEPTTLAAPPTLQSQVDAHVLPEHQVNEWHARGIVLAPVDGRLHDPVLLDLFLRRVRMDYPDEKIFVAEDGVLRVTTYETENNVGPHLDWRD